MSCFFYIISRSPDSEFIRLLEITMLDRLADTLAKASDVGSKYRRRFTYNIYVLRIARIILSA